jgi:hypothetical protein
MNISALLQNYVDFVNLTLTTLTEVKNGTMIIPDGSLAAGASQNQGVVGRVSPKGCKNLCGVTRPTFK